MQPWKKQSFQKTCLCFYVIKEIFQQIKIQQRIEAIYVHFLTDLYAYKNTYNVFKISVFPQSQLYCGPMNLVSWVTAEAKTLLIEPLWFLCWRKMEGNQLLC